MGDTSDPIQQIIDTAAHQAVPSIDPPSQGTTIPDKKDSPSETPKPSDKPLADQPNTPDVGTKDKNQSISPATAQNDNTDIKRDSSVYLEESHVVPMGDASLPPPPPPPKPKKQGVKIAALITVLLLLVTLPVAIFFTSQRQKQVTETRSRADNTHPCLAGFCRTSTGDRSMDHSDCVNSGGTWVSICCNPNDSASRTWAAGGYCSAACGGNCAYDAGSGNWQQTSCSTSACHPTATPTPSVAVPDCTHLTTTADLNNFTVGQTYTFKLTAGGTAPITNAELSVVSSENGCNKVGNEATNLKPYAPRAVTSPGTYDFTWTPAQTGPFIAYGRVWNDGIAECRSACVDGVPRYLCASASSCKLTGTVKAAEATPTPTPTSTPTPKPTPTSTPTPGPTATPTPPSTPTVPVAGSGPGLLGVTTIIGGAILLLLGFAL